jgi:uncharacterized RDD family membrane protein YckC
MSTTGTRVPPLLGEITSCAPAPLGWRLLALILDTLLAGVVAALLLTRFILPQEMPDAEEVANRQLQAWHTFLTAVEKAPPGSSLPSFTLDPEYVTLSEITNQTFFLVLLVYFAASELGLQGATLGKRIFRLRAAQVSSAEPPRPIETLVRCIIKTVSLVGWQSISLVGWPILLLNLAPLVFHRSRRAGHDLLARTIVTGDPLPPSLEKPAYADED